MQNYSTKICFGEKKNIHWLLHLIYKDYVKIQTLPFVMCFVLHLPSFSSTSPFFALLDSSITFFSLPLSVLHAPFFFPLIISLLSLPPPSTHISSHFPFTFSLVGFYHTFYDPSLYPPFYILHFTSSLSYTPVLLYQMCSTLSMLEHVSQLV